MTRSCLQSEITVRVLCFAQLRDRLGNSGFDMVLPTGTTGQDLVDQLMAREPSLKPLLEVSRLAINCEFVALDQILKEGDEIAVLPPVSGG